MSVYCWEEFLSRTFQFSVGALYIYTFMSDNKNILLAMTFLHNFFSFELKTRFAKLEFVNDLWVILE